MTLRDLLGYLLCLAVLVIIVGRADAQVYKWRDAKGQLVYGNVGMPPGAKALEDSISVVPLREANEVVARGLLIERGAYIGSYSSVAVLPDIRDTLSPRNPDYVVFDGYSVGHSIAVPFNAYLPPALPVYVHPRRPWTSYGSVPKRRTRVMLESKRKR